MHPTPFPCPHCAFAYELDADYLAAYGGQATDCSNCGRPMTLPVQGRPPGHGHAGAAAPLPPDDAHDPNIYGVAPAAEPPAAVLAYAAPRVRQREALRAWRDRGDLVVASLSELPERCVKCNAPAVGPPFRRTFYWHEPWVFATVLLGLIVYVIVALAVRRSGRITFSLCDAHRTRRAVTMAVGWVVAASSVGMFVLAYRLRESGLVPLGIIALIAGLIVVVTAARVMSARRIVSTTLWLRGAGRPFLETLPPVR